MRSKQTYTEQQRRSQLVAAAIEVIAQQGYAQASLSVIAGAAGTSKGVLLYHFDGKDDLVAAVVTEVMTVAREVVGPAVHAAGGPRERLAAYITERIRFLATHRGHMLALLDIAISRRSDGERVADVSPEPAVNDVEALLVAGQDEGVFRDFDPRPMAVCVSQAVDGVLLALVSGPDPDLDLERWAHEISTTFDLATRRNP